MKIIFPFWGTGAKLEKLKKQVGELEQKIRQVQEHSALEVADLQQKLVKLDNPLVIEYVYVDRITVDRLELCNNFGALGIRELGGTLSIGMNCAGGRLPGAGKIPLPDEKQGTPPGSGSFPGSSAKEKGKNKAVKYSQEDVSAGDLPPRKGKTREGKNPLTLSDRRQKGAKSGPVLNIGYGG